ANQPLNHDKEKLPPDQMHQLVTLLRAVFIQCVHTEQLGQHRQTKIKCYAGASHETIYLPITAQKIGVKRKCKGGDDTDPQNGRMSTMVANPGIEPAVVENPVNHQQAAQRQHQAAKKK